MDMEIDARAILSQALDDTKPGEDTDEAILRACKTHYPGQHTEVFAAVTCMIEAAAEQEGLSKPDAVRRLVETSGTVSIRLRTSSGSAPVAGQPSGTPVSLDDLPPEIRARVEQAIASGQNHVTIRTAVSGPRRAGAPGQMFRCRHCGFTEPGQFDRCPHCGKGQRRGLLGWLLGR